MVPLDLKSAVAKQVLDDARDEGILPVSMNYMSLEMLARVEFWCETHCKGRYEVDPMYRMKVFFADPQDAMLFKLSQG